MAAPMSGIERQRHRQADRRGDARRWRAWRASRAGVTAVHSTSQITIGRSRAAALGWDVIRLRVPGALALPRSRGARRRRRVQAGRHAGGRRPVRSATRDFDNQVVSAFGEAFNNAAHPQLRGRTPATSRSRSRSAPAPSPSGCIDYGNSFDLDDVPDPDLEALPESGLGMYIIRSFMDEVKYVAGTPNVLSMTKYVDPGRRQVPAAS